MKYLNALASAALFVAGVASPSGLLGAHAQDAAPPRFALPQSRRRLDHHVEPTDDIAAYVEQQHAAGVERPQFTLVAVVNATAAAAGGTRLLNEGTTYEIDVIQAAPSVTSDTTVIAADGTSALASAYLDSSKTLFVSANQRTGDFALISVSRDGVDGISKKAGEDLVKVTQVPGGATTVSPPEPFTPPAWQCGVTGSGGGAGGGRRLGHDHVHDHHDHDHVHDHQGHTHEHHHDEDRQDSDFLSRLQSELSDVTIGNIERIDLGEGRRELWPTDTFPQTYSYQVNLYIETDEELRSKTSGGTGTSEEQTATVTNYVNALVSAASRLFEEEVDTHLNVVAIVETTNYDSYSSTSAALTQMKSIYGSTTWHTTGINLHHGLLGNDMGGGIAYTPGLCDPDGGFGLSASLTGAIASYGAPMYLDINFFAHEVGHNFGAEHTHEDRDPLVDECGIGTCPSLLGTGEATIMSYCHQCTGGFSNIGWTFGGHWGEDDRRNIDNWVENPNIGTFNINAKRVPKGMWEYASNLGTCMATSGTVPEVVCSNNADCDDGNSCTTDTCTTGQCVNTMNNNCCGNFICEPGESGTCSDCEPSLASPGIADKYGKGIMFSIEAIGNLTVQSLTFVPYDASGTATSTVDIFTASGGWSDKESNSVAWTQIVSGQAFSAISGTDVNINISFADVSVNAGSTQSFYLATDFAGGLFAGGETSDPLVSDSHVKILNPARGKFSQFSTGYSGTWSWYGQVSYQVPEIGTPSPSKSPTKNPTASPSTSPTSGPTENPSTAAPTTSPTASPSTSPTTGPTAGPTKSPVPAPTANPTVAPSKNPTASPSMSPTTGPTESPTTAAPTTSPTKSPSMSPTTGPTAGPTKSPVPAPTANPTVAPSKNPTASPSTSPTTGPTESPTTAAPTTSPTKSPSTSPTTGPTAGPTKNPVPAPTANPTVAPSKNPTASPSTSPTTGPTENPTTAAPTTSPTKSPSMSPTTGPTAGPTGSPVPPPTANPTVAPSKNPTASPSTSPTTGPTQNPTTAAPTTSPTASPSTSPTTGPTAGPTGSPVPPPTANPTVAPSKNPTTSPSTPNPTNAPTSKPTLPPQTITDLLAAFSSESNSKVTIEVTGAVEIDGVACTTDPDDSDFQASICDQLCASANARPLDCSCTISDIVLGDCTRRLQGRSLQTTGQLAIDFVLQFIAYCNDEDGGCDTEDITEVAQAVLQATDTNLAEAFTPDGGGDSPFIAALKDAVTQSAEVAAAFSSAVVDEGSFSADIDIEQVVAAVLEIFREWYPAWSSNKHTCLNDGAAPLYMKRLGTYYEQSLADCCERFFSWDYVTCTGGTESSVTGFYPNWGSSEVKCLNATEELPPNYMRRNPEQWLHDDIDGCCEAYYHFDYDNCVEGTGGTLAASSTGKWYVDHQDELCRKDCPTEDGGSCGGSAKPWLTLWETVAACCENELQWIAAPICEATSTSTAAIGTQQYYIDWNLEKCVKDCEDSSDQECGGIAASYDPLYSKDACCDRLWWLEQSECTL